MITVILLTMMTSIIILYIHNIAFVIILTYLWYLNIQNERTYKLKKKIYENINTQIEKNIKNNSKNLNALKYP